MSFTFDKTNYATQCQELEQVGAWLTKIGIETENTRFAEVLQINNEVFEHYNSDCLDKLIDKHGNINGVKSAFDPY